LEKIDKKVLTKLSFDMKAGDMLTVVGPVGCGKTSLLFSVMEETSMQGGSSTINGSIAYVE
jgi:ABC-type hemin transport system ATPase subunit